jgi:hypothetical protein
LQVDGVKVPRLTEEDVKAVLKAVLQQKELPEKISRMTQNPAFDEFLRKLAKTSEVVESLRPLMLYERSRRSEKAVRQPRMQEMH